MLNSGGKNVFKKIGRSLFGPQTEQGQVSYAVPGLFPAAEEQAKTQFGALPGLEQYFGGISDEIMAGARGLDVNIGEDALRRKMREALLPTLAARGLATGGPGVSADVGIESELAQKQFERATQRQLLLQQAAQGVAILKALPLELRQKLLAVIISQGGAGVPMASTGSILEQISGFMSSYGKLAEGAAAAGAAGAA